MYTGCDANVLSLHLWKVLKKNTVTNSTTKVGIHMDKCTINYNVKFGVQNKLVYKQH
jgi:hypothetical protein